MKLLFMTFYAFFFVFCPGCSDREPGQSVTAMPTETPKNTGVPMENQKVELTDWQWKQKLDPLQYNILRKKGTERPFTGKYYLRPEKDGTYVCAGCGNLIFKTASQFNSHCGWPSFSEAQPDSVQERPDTSHGMVRTEITCARCGGHLGHVFDDGPGPTGLRYCINSAAMEFNEEQ